MGDLHDRSVAIVLSSAAGAASVPQDHRNVARVFCFGRMAYVRHILIPDALPQIVTGLRVSMGVAWMVIVAVEMLSGGVGIGFGVWEAYNASNYAKVVSFVLLVGVGGLLLDTMLAAVGRTVRGPRCPYPWSPATAAHRFVAERE